MSVFYWEGLSGRVWSIKFDFVFLFSVFFFLFYFSLYLFIFFASCMRKTYNSQCQMSGWQRSRKWEKLLIGKDEHRNNEQLDWKIEPEPYPFKLIYYLLLWVRANYLRSRLLDAAANFWLLQCCYKEFIDRILWYLFYYCPLIREVLWVPLVDVVMHA